MPTPVVVQPATAIAASAAPANPIPSLFMALLLQERNEKKPLRLLKLPGFNPPRRQQVHGSLAFRAVLGHRRRSGAWAKAFALVCFEDSRRGSASCRVSDRPRKREDRNMPLYEHVFLARQDLAQAQVDALAENATKILTDNGGKVVKTENWGLKSLAYRIAKNRKAHFVMLDVDAPAQAVAELERQSNINEDIIRFLTIRVDEHEKGPSAMMRRDRDRAARPRREEEVE
jgi:small subunit ribosomal protein S6